MKFYRVGIGLVGVGAVLACACGEPTVEGSALEPHALTAGQSAAADIRPLDPALGSPGDGSTTAVLPDCPHGGQASVVTAVFQCTSVTSYTCKDLSNIVLAFSDGTRQRFEGLSGHENTFSGTGANAGKQIVNVWIKAGANHSGDGPGYGERVDAPDQNCTPPAAGSGGDDPCVVQPDGTCVPPSLNGGAGGCVVGPDQTCSPSGPAGGAGGVGADDSPV